MDKHAMPSGTNTFIPGGVEEKKTPYVTEDGVFKIYPRVSIFEEDEEHTPERLQEMVMKNNRRFADRGVSIPVIVGHTSEDEEDEEEIPVVASGSNLQMGTVGNVDPKAAIFAEFKVPIENVDMVEKQYPRVSIEEWNDGTIDPIALLGGSTPHFEVGFNVDRYNKNRDVIRRYQRNIFAPALTYEVEDMDKDALVGLIAEVIDDTEVGQYVRQMMTSQAAEVEDVNDIEVKEPELNEEEELTNQGVEEQETQTEEVGEAETEATEIADDEKPEPTDVSPEKFEDDDDADVIEEDEEPTKNSDAEVVETAEKDEEPEKNQEDEEEDEDEEKPEKNCKDPEDYPKHFSKEAYQNTVKRYKKAIAEKDELIEDLKQRYSRVERESALTKLHTEYTFDMEEEVEHTADMSDLQFTKHVAVIRKRYSRAPVGKGRVESIELSDSGDTPQFGLEDKMKAVRYATENNCSFAEAMKHTR